MGLLSLFRKTEEPARSLLEIWNTDELLTDDNLRRLHRAVTGQIYPVGVIDRERCSAKIHSERSGEVYNTTLRQCNCQDYLKRMGRGPCKHMFYLTIRLYGYEQTLETAYGVEHDALEVFKAVLYPRDLASILSKCLRGGDTEKKLVEKRTKEVKQLISCGAVKECQDDEAIIGKFNNAELSALIKITGKKPPAKKGDQVEWILRNSLEIIGFCRTQYAVVSIPPEYRNAVRFFLRYLDANNEFPLFELK